MVTKLDPDVKLPDPKLDDGDHDLFSHIVIPSEAVMEAMITGFPAGLCVGKCGFRVKILSDIQFAQCVWIFAEVLVGTWIGLTSYMDRDDQDFDKLLNAVHQLLLLRIEDKLDTPEGLLTWNNLIFIHDDLIE